MLNQLYKMRVFRRLTQQELSELSGVSRKTICDLENEKHLPSVQVARKLCAALQCSYEEVFAHVLV